MLKNLPIHSCLSCLLAVTGMPAMAEISGNPLTALLDAREIPVNIDNFTRAATDIELDKYVSLAGGVNRFFHFREPTPVEQQPTIRMNRDTLYSTVVVDISEGAVLTLPDAGTRYMTAMVVNQDHYINEVFSGGGTYQLDMQRFDTPYVVVFLRMLVDAADPEDVAEVNAIQDAMTIEAASSRPFIMPDYDEESFDGLLRAAIEIGRFAPDSFRVFGARDEVEPLRHFIGTAVGWGGLPEAEAFYLNVDPGLPVGEYRIDVPADVPVDAFWSLSLYNAEGFFEPNPLGAYNVNSVGATPSDDGGVTVHLGGCEDGRVNCLPIMEGWNYTVRLYRPGSDVLDGSWTFPTATPLN